MSSNRRFFDRLHNIFLSERVKHKSEEIIIYVAIFSFAIHVGLILLIDFDILPIEKSSKLLTNPIAAIYTPFSFILVYEVYLLVYYLPKSITIYIGKQYEIITLIVIRRIFKDLSNLELSSQWFQIKDDLQFTYDITATIVLFFLISIFYQLNAKKFEKAERKEEKKSAALQSFIQKKRIIATCLVPFFLILAVYSFGDWIFHSFFSIKEMVSGIKDVNDVFFDIFFTVLILMDVLLLLFSFMNTDQFSKVIRNSGFIISTILIRLSFSVDGLLNTLLIVVAVLFGILILAIHNRYEKINFPNKL